MRLYSSMLASHTLKPPQTMKITVGFCPGTRGTSLSKSSREYAVVSVAAHPNSTSTLCRLQKVSSVLLMTLACESHTCERRRCVHGLFVRDAYALNATLPLKSHLHNSGRRDGGTERVGCSGCQLGKTSQSHAIDGILNDFNVWICGY